MRVNRRTFVGVCAAVCAPAMVSTAAAQDPSWPSKPIRIIVGFPPGQATDVLVRAYADELAKMLGQAVVVENKPGAGATLAAETSAQSAPDGYTIYYGSSGPMAIAPHLYKLRFDPMRDLEPVASVATVPFVLVVSTNSPYKTLQDLLAAGRGPDGPTINYGSSGNGSTSHLAMELFKSTSRTKFAHVPYKGSVQALTDVAGNNVQLTLESTTAVLPFVRSGRVRPLATSTQSRFPDLPDVPTMAETFPGFEVSAWGLFFVPKGTPAAIARRFATVAEQVTGSQAMKERLAAQALVPFIKPSAELRGFVEREYETWGKVVKATGAKVS